MMVRVGLEILIAIATFAFSGFFWPLVKRQALLKKLVHDQDFLRSLTREAVSGPLPSGHPYAEKHPQGYAVNVLLLLESDKRAIRGLQLRFGVPLIVLLGGSYFLGPVYLLVNLGISALLALVPLGESGRASAIAEVLTLARILYRWHEENPQESDEFVKEAWSIRELYQAVVRAS